VGLIGALSVSGPPPLDPDAGQARDQLIAELSKPEYQSTKPGLIDLLATWLRDWLEGILNGVSGARGPAGLGNIVIIVLVVAAIVVAFLVFGVPRLNRRSSVAGTLFGEDDSRDSDALRAAAARAASAGDYSTAIAEQFRAIARSLSERGIVTTFPGTTATGFATRAATSFPAEAGALDQAAVAFDGVRYLGRVGTADEWATVDALATRMRTAKPSDSTAALATAAVPK
jgi:hypothetical protein